jgi:hypothetical protein
MTYLDEHIRDIVVKDAKEVKSKEYLCIKDYIMDDNTLAYKKGTVYSTDGALDAEGFFVMPSIFDKTHRMDTSGDFYEHFLDIDKERNKTAERFKNYKEESEWDIISKNYIPTKDSVVNKVIQSFIERSELGFNKYGTNLDRKDLSALEWINHFQQELQDGILYAEKLKSYVPNQIPRVIVINEKDSSDGEINVIGVASDRENALRIIKEYYGEESTMLNFKDIRDSGLDFTALIEVPGNLGGKYNIWADDFYINEV